MKPNTLKIDDVEYVRADSVNSRNMVEGDVYIVVLQRGFVAVGHRATLENGDYVLRDAAHIRVWGTTKGLGEIAENGPTSKTILDKCPPIEFHPLTAIMHIKCVEGKWNTKLS